MGERRSATPAAPILVCRARASLERHVMMKSEARSAPDTAAIERWEAELAQFASELRGLCVYDQKKLASICRRYGRETKRLDALELRPPESAPKPEE